MINSSPIITIASIYYSINVNGTLPNIVDIYSNTVLKIVYLQGYISIYI